MRRVLFDKTCREAIECVKQLRLLVDERFFEHKLLSARTTVDQTHLDHLLLTANAQDADFLRILALLFMLRIREITQADTESTRLLHMCTPILESTTMWEYAHQGYDAYNQILVQLRKLCSQ